MIVSRGGVDTVSVDVVCVGIIIDGCAAVIGGNAGRQLTCTWTTCCRVYLWQYFLETKHTHTHTHTHTHKYIFLSSIKRLLNVTFVNFGDCLFDPVQTLYGLLTGWASSCERWLWLASAMFKEDSWCISFSPLFLSSFSLSPRQEPHVKQVISQLHFLKHTHKRIGTHARTHGKWW